MAQVMQHSERYEDMFGFVKQLISHKQTDFTLDERELLSQSFKKVVQRDRDAIKLVRDVASSDRFSNFHSVLFTFKRRLHENIVDRCQEISSLCQEDCLKLAENSESRVFFYKLIGDYNRDASGSFDAVSQPIVEEFPGMKD